MDYSLADDAAVLALVARGDQQALAELYDRFHRPCYSFAVRMVGGEGDAEEVIQETFVRAWRHAPRYEPERASVQGWLLSITRNLCIDELRRRRRRATHSGPFESEQEPPAPERTDLQAERAILQQEVRAALRSLSPEQRSAIELVYFHGLTSQEVGAALHVPAPTVRSRLRLGLLKLATVLQEKGVMASA